MDDGAKLRVQFKKQSKRQNIVVLHHLESADAKWKQKCQMVVNDKISATTAMSALKELARRVLEGSLKLQDVKMEKEVLAQKILKAEWKPAEDEA